ESRSVYAQSCNPTTPTIPHMGKTPFISPERRSVRVETTVLKMDVSQDSRRVGQKKAPFAFRPPVRVFLSEIIVQIAE
ncbi:MAG: hypothetical protein VW647_10810, partial [Alphaproteobacteria bacterium]